MRGQGVYPVPLPYGGIELSKPENYMRRLGKNIFQHYELYLLVLPAVVYFALFHYAPLYGIQIAFRNYYPGFSIANSEFIGWDNFARFFQSYQSKRVIWNTLRISGMSLVIGFPGPILLALMLNHVTNLRYKKVVQTVSYAPYFISAVAMAGMITLFFSTNGMFNNMRKLMGKETIQFMGKANLFPWIYVLANVWKNLGWNSIIYIAALASVDLDQYEAARIDGANKLHIIWHIEIPSIMPTMVVLLIMNCGRIMSVGHEQILLLQNSLNAPTSEIISTYVYKMGLLNNDYGYSTAIGLFNSIVNLVLLVSVNWISGKISANSLW